MSDKYYVEPIIIDREASGVLDFQDAGHPYEINNFYFREVIKQKNSPKLSIAVLSYKNIESVKLCVECVLRFTSGLDYELVLMDNASEDDDETYNFFQSVPHETKKVIQMKNNPGAYYNAFRGFNTICRYCEGDYILQLNDDHFITENAVQNMMRALDENPDIGAVNPMSSNVWMYQSPNLEFSTIEEMFEAAARFNKYNPKKWQERIYLNAIAAMSRRELLGCGLSPNPYIHELYSDILVYHEGYRIMLLGDTWVHHNHDYNIKETYGFAGESEEKKKQRERMEALSKHYHFGLDFHTEICAFEFDTAGLIESEHIPEKNGDTADIRLLGVDVKAGQGLLDVKNRLRNFGIFNAHSTVFSSDYRYYPVLYMLADEAFCDRIDFIQEHCRNDTYDVVICGEPINIYTAPLILLEKLYGFVKPGGLLLFKVRNTNDFNSFIRSVGYSTYFDSDMPATIHQDDLIDCLNQLGATDIFASAEHIKCNEEDKERMYSILSKAKDDVTDDDLYYMTIKNYLYRVVKN